MTWVLERFYKEVKEYKFECDILDTFISGTIRVRFMIPHEHDSKPIDARFYNTNPDLVREMGHGRLNISEEELQEVRFLRHSDYKQQIKVWYDSEELRGMRSLIYASHTADSNNATKFHNWNFTRGPEWSFKEFWYSLNTTHLFGTRTYKLGESSP